MLLHIEHDFSEVEVNTMQAEQLYFAVLRNAVKPSPLASVFYGRNGIRVVYGR